METLLLQVRATPHNHPTTLLHHTLTMPVAYTYSISTYVYTTVSYGYMTYTTVPALQNEV